MDGKTFDLLTQSVAQRISRRVTFRRLLASLAAGTLGHLDRSSASAARCRKVGTSCRRRPGKPKPKCCPGSVCRGNRCRCRPNRTTCGKKCLTKRQCCRNNQCPNNQRCNRRTNRCGCGKNQQRCQGKCIAASQCCSNTDCLVDQICTSQHACGQKACQATTDCASGVCSCTEEGQPPVPDAHTCQAEHFSQPFTTNANGWHALLNGTWLAPATNGTLTIVDRKGQIAPVDSENPFVAASPLGGYSPIFPDGGFTTSIEVLLDPSMANPEGQSFSYSVAINSNDACGFGSEYQVQGGAGSQGGFCVRIGGSTGHDPCQSNNAEAITKAGWYTIKHRFFEEGGQLSITRTVEDPVGTPVTEITVSNQGAIASVGGNRFASFPFNSFTDGLRIRNSTRTNGSA